MHLKSIRFNSLMNNINSIAMRYNDDIKIRVLLLMHLKSFRLKSLMNNINLIAMRYKDDIKLN